MTLPLQLLLHFRLVALLQLLPEFFPLGRRVEFLFTALRLQARPHRERHQLLRLVATKLNFHAAEAVIEEHQQRCLLTDDRRSCFHNVDLLQALLQDLAEQQREALGFLLEDLPHFDALAELLIQEEDDGHDVSRRRFLVEVRQEIIFQVAAELEDHDATGIAARHFFVVDLLDDGFIERKSIFWGCFNRPILRRELKM